MGDLSKTWRAWLDGVRRFDTFGRDRTKEAKEGIGRLCDHLDAAERKRRAAEGVVSAHIDTADRNHQRAVRARAVLVGVVEAWGEESGADVAELVFRLKTKTLGET